MCTAPWGELTEDFVKKIHPLGAVSRHQRGPAVGRNASPGLHRRLYDSPPAGKTIAATVWSATGGTFRDRSRGSGPDGLRHLHAGLRPGRSPQSEPVQLVRETGTCLLDFAASYREFRKLVLHEERSRPDIRERLPEDGFGNDPFPKSLDEWANCFIRP